MTAVIDHLFAKPCRTRTFNSGTLTIAETEGIGRQSGALSTFSKQQHHSASTNSAASEGGGAKRFWMVIHDNGQLIGGGFNRTNKVNDIWCGESIAAAPKTQFVHPHAANGILNWCDAGPTLTAIVTYL